MGNERGAFTGADAAREGKFQLAEGDGLPRRNRRHGPEGAQAKLLRVIENKEVYTLGSKIGQRLNVRVVCATNQDPERLVRENRFRKDLYFRLNVARIHLVPLRERKEDIPALVEHSIPELNRRFGTEVEGCSEDAIALLQRYEWPGNVRELKNVLEATFIGLNARVIGPGDFPPTIHRWVEMLEATPIDERARLISALSATKWNVSKAAGALHWSADYAVSQDCEISDLAEVIATSKVAKTRHNLPRRFPRSRIRSFAQPRQDHLRRPPGEASWR